MMIRRISEASTVGPTMKEIPPNKIELQSGSPLVTNRLMTPINSLINGFPWGYFTPFFVDQCHPPTPTPTWMDFPNARQRHIDTWKTEETPLFFRVFCNNDQGSKKLFHLVGFSSSKVLHANSSWGKWCLVKVRYLISRLAWTRLLQYFFECSLSSFRFKPQVFSKESHCRLLFHFTWCLPNVTNISSAHLSFCLKVATIFTTIIVMLR